LVQAKRRTPATEQLAEAFKAPNVGDVERAVDELIAAIPNADGREDDLRAVVVGILDDLGVEHPLARNARRRLASALY
jgi:putative thioredoxin